MRSRERKPEGTREKGEERVGPDRRGDASAAGPEGAADLLHLQRTAGNQAVRRLLGPGGVQTKLRVNRAGDPYEREADRVAEQVTRGGAPGPAPSISRGSGQVELAPWAADHVRAALRGGRSLTPEERGFFGPRMGTELGGVRVHDDAAAAKSAAMLGARAYAYGGHVVLGRGEYDFARPEGKRLMAHELTHVVQSGGDRVLRRNPLAAMGAAEWIAAAALGVSVAQDAVASSAGDITWKLDEASGVLLPGGRTDVERYQRENPNLTVESKELVVSFWRGHEDSKKAGITFGLSFLTDGKGIGNVSSRIIDTHDWAGWGANCSVDLMPQTFVSARGKAVIRVTLTNAYVFEWVGVDWKDGVDSEIWNLEGDGNFTRVRNDNMMWVEHHLT